MVKERKDPPRAHQDGLLLIYLFSFVILLFFGIVGYVIYAAVRVGQFRLAAGPISAQVRDVLWFSFLCGAACAATIEVAKRIFRLRGIYQRRQVNRWMAQRTPEISQKACDDLSALMGGTDRSTYATDLPIEQLVAQISTAVDIALTRPSRYRFLLACLAGDKNLSKLLNDGGGSPTDDEGAADGEGATAAMSVYYMQRVQAGVDQLQVSVGERWRHYVQATAVWVSGAYGVALSSAGSSWDARPRYIIAALIIGGPLAWILRDITAVIERWRR
ncbi:hypothetical protein OOK12_31050 [Streptomyces sp. NBC_00452]|uniref:hypothetical protein n=1 Tax=Streptomyces sp. NBC_00452 TaxID=2975746 RepID=UPI00225178E7|nr:hypothetical protein [Streptomyces sp. NBC_00452]MCX5061399.1 hypothetical protein [Streptomyces sp. NBC_00452]